MKCWEVCAGQESSPETDDGEQKLFCSTEHLFFSMRARAHMHTLCVYLRISSFFFTSLFLGIVVTRCVYGQHPLPWPPSLFTLTLCHISYFCRLSQMPFICPARRILLHLKGFFFFSIKHEASHHSPPQCFSPSRLSVDVFSTKTTCELSFSFLCTAVMDQRKKKTVSYFYCSVCLLLVYCSIFLPCRTKMGLFQSNGPRASV